MEFLNHLVLGFSVALTWHNLLYAFIGCFMGTLIGILPGLGPLATISMLLPFTYNLEPTSALIMLAGIYYGAQYGGSTTAILVNLPGESSSVVTALDGYRMARNGQAGTALATAALGSFFAGTVGTLLLAGFAAPLIDIALKFGPQDYFSLMSLGLVGSIVLAHGSLLKALAMIFLGLLLGMIGTDVNSGQMRFTFGFLELNEGVNFVVIAMGIFGFGEIIKNLGTHEAERESFISKVGSLFPSWQDFKAMFMPVIRGTGLGSLLGILPGGGAVLASFSSYTLEKKVAGQKARPPFGQGNIRGVAGPESANNAAAQTSFIPMLTLGIPSNAVMALMIGAMTIHNIQPGPQVMSGNPQLFWGLVASMWVGNFMLVVMNLPLIGVWVQLLKVKYHYLYPCILMFCCVGVYSLNGSIFDVWVMAVFGAIGFLLMKLECEPAPLLLGLILGPMMEEYLRRALTIHRGDWSVFVTSPISATFLALAVLLLVIVLMPNIRQKREAAFQDD